MDSALWLAVIATAAGTYAMRVVPLLWMQRHLNKHSDKDALEVVPQWLTILGPLMIAAMLGVSLIPKTPDVNGWMMTACGGAMTLLVWWRTRSLGLPVVVGVATYGAVKLLL